MKTLYIIRHAKTNRSKDDLKRELIPLGIERTNKLGKYLKDKKCKVDILFSSYAKRAMQTAEIIAENIKYPKEKIISKESLYLTSQEQYFNIILEQNDSVNSIMIVGHNPEISNVAQFFVADFMSYMQTGACICLEFKTDNWIDIFTAERVAKFYIRCE